MKLRYLLLGLCLVAFAAPKALAQDYRNVINTRFNTVSSGPMQAIIVDVANPADTAAVNRAVAEKVNAARRSRQSGIQRQLDFLRRTLKWKGEASPGIPDVVYIRSKGRLAIPSRTSRAYNESNNITFNFPLTAALNDGGWTQAQRDELVAITSIMYPALKTVYGAPSWNGTVTVRNGDFLPSGLMSDPNAISGGVYNVSTNEILFAQYNSVQSKVLNLTQMMALAFHGPAQISYDAWERGMARAATLESVRTVLPLLTNAFGAGSVNVADPLWHALDRYDQLNQPPLGNDRFFPVSKVNGDANTASFPNMLIPRLMMSGSAWLKVAAETPSFFRNFNTAYYNALDTNANLKNSIPELKNIAQAALPSGQVEGLSFNDWYQRQYILDTSVSPGTKLYALVSPLRPDPGDDDFGFAVVLYYYQTLFDAQGNSDEKNLNGVSYPIYWDYNFQNRLFLAAQYERVDIRDGIGTVAPTFFATIGSPETNGRMRVAMDFPVNFENVRVYGAPRSMGKADQPNNFWGTVVGADDGKIRIQTDTGANQELDVKLGAFGGVLDPNPFTRPARATLTFTNTSGEQVTQRIVNTGYGEFVPVIYANDPVTSLTHTFPAGPEMISFPIRPLRPRANEALLNPANDQPLFNEGNLLLAQWRQNLNNADGDNYLRFPTMDPLQPGKGYWENFAGPTAIKLTGRSTALEQDISLGLLHGWNQIGNPYETTIDINSLQFQYLADNVPVDLATAIGKGYIVAQNVPGVGMVAIWEYDPAVGYKPATQLVPWKGYWIRVLVSEGVTITYPNPAGRAGRRAPITRSALSTIKPARGWSLPLSIRSNDGLGATAYLGQSDEAGSGYDDKIDAQRPPEFSRAVPSVSFAHPEWGQNAGNYFSDIRRTGSRDPWEVTVYTPDPKKSYSLTWSNLSSVPRTTRLVLVDTATGKRQYMQSSSGYSFVPGDAPTRKFQIQVEDRTRGGLQIMNISARPTRGVGSSIVDISYNLSQGATVTTEIRGADGKLIRRLTPGRAAAVGTNNVVWDARDDRAVSVPSGPYIVQITARTPEGETARAVQMVTIVR